jgi:hypothetical protein
MGVLLPIFGGITASLILRTFTSLPFWACLLIGIPVGTVTAWLLFVVLAFCFYTFVEKPIEAVRERRKQKIRDRFNG